MDERPFALFRLGFVAVGQIGRHARQQPHPIDERDAALRLALNLLPMVDRFL